MAIHDHEHHHGEHAHYHAPTSFGTAFAVGTLLNSALVVTQIVYGVLAHSTALLADAAHNFGDVLGLLLAWSASVAVRWHPTERYTYGFRSSSILAALLNAVILLVATGAIAWEATQRLFEPQQVSGLTVIAVAAVGIAINTLTARMLMAGGQGDLNVQGASLHMIADAAVSAGVVAAGLAIYLTGWDLIDPLTSLVISGVIVWTTWGLLRSSLNMSLHAVPPDIDSAKVRNYLEHLPGVTEVHDLHIWPMSTTETALTCHLIMPAGHPGTDFFIQVEMDLQQRFHIQHPTIQIELGECPCKLAPAETL